MIDVQKLLTYKLYSLVDETEIKKLKRKWD